MTIGIYKLNFKNTSKCYIGQSNNIELRYISHCTALKAGKASQKLQYAYNKYGIPTLEILLECSIEELDENEDLAIEIFNSVEDGFNTRYCSGHRTQLKGELAGNSKYSNELIINVFKELVFTNKTHKEIQETWGISRGAIADISRGSTHLWLKDVFPEEYAILEYKKKVRRTDSIRRSKGGAKSGKYPLVISPEGIQYEVVHLRQFCREHNLTHGAFGEMLRGTKASYKGWKVLDRIGI